MPSTKTLALFALFIALLVAMNLTGVKIVRFLGADVSVAIFMVPLTFLITDIVEEVHGPKLTRQFVFSGIIAIVLVFVFTAIFVQVPPHERFPYDDCYRVVFGNSMRIMIASVVAFGLAQLHDVYAFEWWKKRTGGKWLWLRNNLSTMVSQLIDTFAFMFIAFYQAAPQYTASFLIDLSLTYYLFKIAFALLDTPLVYLGVYWLKKDLR